jgi:hypothetical protein
MFKLMFQLSGYSIAASIINDSRRTLELTRRERAAFYQTGELNDERLAVERSG